VKVTSFISPRTKLFRHLDRLQAIKAGQKPPPVNVEIDPSNVCSLGCSWCHFGYTHTRGPLAGKHSKPQDAIAGGHLLDFALAQNILTQLAEYGVKSVTWTGGGEPTLNPHFNDLVRYAVSVGLEQGLYTHGGHIDDERAMLLKSTLEWAYVSLDECTPETYKRSKGVNRFQHATDGIRRLVAAEGKATIGVGFLLHPGNYTQIYNMVQLGRSLGVDYVQFRPTIHFSQDQPNKLVEDTAWVHEAIRLLRQYGGDSFVIADLERFARYADWQGHDYPTCHWAALQTVITPNGKVWRCTNKREHPDGLLGDLSVESFESLWQRSGGSCSVLSTCRVACKGDPGNQTLNELFSETPHENFV
jgi:MoaA/NifB/PqqE/SkfB family radical SAM enzyme